MFQKQLPKFINTTYNLFLLLIPLVMAPFTSEIFELNKTIFIYGTTITISTLFLLSYLFEGRVKTTKKPIFFIPLFILLLTNILSTFFSIDRYTSIWGYYGRFNQGLLLTLCFVILSLITARIVNKENIKYKVGIIMTSSIIVSFYGILQRLGIDKSIWSQDVVNRVFSSIGQPNWLGAYLVAVTPLSFYSLFNFIRLNKTIKGEVLKILITGLFFILPLLLFVVLLFTKSRSAMLSYLVVFPLLTVWYIYTDRKLFKTISFILISLGILFMSLPNPLSDQIKNKAFHVLKLERQEPIIMQDKFIPALEQGGTESGEIRKYVWQGAYRVFLRYPIFGSGVETFAYSFYREKPAAHNLTSEWDYLYNKAHNEYLNIMATTGSFGFTAYLFLIFSFIFQFYKTHINLGGDNSNLRDLNMALFLGFISLLITNFFGFSVILTNTLFFILPAFSYGLNQNKNNTSNITKLSRSSYFFLIIILGIYIYLISLLVYFFLGDVSYNKGKNLNLKNEPQEATKELTRAINLSPLQPIYHDELAQSYTLQAKNAYAQKDMTEAKNLAEKAIDEINLGISLSPGNIHFWKSKAAIFIRLSELDPKLGRDATTLLERIIPYSPTDPKIYYNLALLYSDDKDIDKTISYLSKAIDLKSNYKDARYALYFFYKKQGFPEKAKVELEYILKFIAPNDEFIKTQLQKLEKV